MITGQEEKEELFSVIVDKRKSVFNYCSNNSKVTLST